LQNRQLGVAMAVILAEVLVLCGVLMSYFCIP
jgi:hypothetical protein